MTASNTLERTGDHRGRAVRAEALSAPTVVNGTARSYQ
jgi:hypothetical protein